MRIGHVDVKSGGVVIFDFGLLPDVEGGVTIRDVPLGRHPVVSEALADGEFAGLRHSLTVDFAEGVEAARTIEIGTVAVDMARLGVFDVDALEHWNESDPADGKADIVFWGLNGEQVARRLDAPKVDEGSYGFVDLPAAEAFGIAERLNALRESGEFRFAFDFRPHTHAFFLLAQMRQNESEAGVISVGGHDVCGLMTSWGDGFFPVTLDVAADGRPLRARVLFATDATLAAMREVNS